MNASAQPAARASRTPGWQAWLRRLLLFAVLWWVLSGGGGWYLGAPFVLLGTWLSLNLWTEYRLSLGGVARFLPWFAVQSLAGASDVARRALLPSMPLQPGLVRHRLRLPAGVCRVSLANVVTMLPGTLSADLIDDELVVHALDTGRDMHAMVLDLEPRIAALFGIALDAPATTRGGP
jgi:multicomponent Na+:H+ antiporter subunit E